MFFSWKSSNKSYEFILNVVNRFAYSDERSDFSRIDPEMEAFINDNRHKIPDLMLNVRTLTRPTWPRSNKTFLLFTGIDLLKMATGLEGTNQNA